MAKSAAATTSDSHATKAGAGKSHGGGHWGYEGKAGPAHWSSLSGDYRLCGEGSAQSPINIESFSGASVQPIEFDYNLTTLSIVHNGHTIQVNYAPGSGITVAGKRFELLQFHFHTPSEHAVDGKQTVMEVHFVHKAEDGSLAVVGAMMESGEENLALREIWSAMPRKAGPAREVPNTLINARDLLPRDTGYYRYMGSLTTPPCSEGVNWYVLNEPISVSIGQAEQFVAAAGHNARPVQPVNHRLVLAPMAGH